MKIYLVTLVFGLSLLGLANALPLPAFGTDPTRLGCNGREVLLDSKMEQVRRSPAYDLMTFGNSRILSVGAEEMGLAERHRFFSMAAGGTSFRQSVAVLEEVSRSGKAPKVAVLSFDHVAMLYAQLPYDWPPPPARWRMVAGDLSGLVQGPYVVGADWRKFMKRLFIVEMEQVARLFNVSQLLNRAGVALGLPRHEESCGAPWLAEGTQKTAKPPAADLDGQALNPMSFYDDRYPLLEHDLDRLAAIRAGGVRVVVYESPIYPALLPSIAASLHPEMSRQRQRLFAGCASRELICLPSPEIHGNKVDGYWPDQLHAPPKALGSWIAGQLAPHLATIAP
jgi:hypothetical protein